MTDKTIGDDGMDITYAEMTPEQDKFFEAQNAYQNALRNRDEYRRELLDVATRIYPEICKRIRDQEQLTVIQTIEAAVNFAEYFLSGARCKAEAAVPIPERPVPPDPPPFGSIGRVPMPMRVPTRLRPIK